jgi:hypothetical protein
LPFNVFGSSICQKRRILTREPVSKPHPQLLHAFHTSGTCEEFGAEQANIGSLIGQPMQRRKVAR